MAQSARVACPHCGRPSRIVIERPPVQNHCPSCGGPLFGGPPVLLSGETFEHHLRSHDIPLLVDFMADWCAPCRQMAPAVEHAARVLAPRVRVARVDTDEDQKLAGRHRIRGLPTLVLFHHGHEIGRHAGAMAPGALVRWVEGATAEGSRR